MNHYCRFLVGNAEAILLLAVFAEQMGLPLPAIPMLLGAGALIANGVLDPLAALLIIVVATLVADVIWFYLGRRRGAGVLSLLRRLSLCNARSLARTERMFVGHGMAAVVASKFVPCLGFLVPPLAATFGVGMVRFLAFDLLGALLYATVYLALGYLFDGQVTQGLEIVRHCGTGTALLLLVVVLAVVSHKHIHRRKAGLVVADSPGASSLSKT